MDYQKIWDKTLSKGEEVKYSFSIGDRYIKFNLIAWGVVSVFLLPAMGFGVLTFLIALFYYKFYLRVANAYAFTNKRVLIHTGWLSTHSTSIDYSKITDVHVREPFFDKVVTKTGDIAINTAGSGAIEVILRHIEKPYEIKKQLDEMKD
ncbi:MAG: PH domain-containing protein [Patescibacteria group bacterium]|jgi:uncharacterized membrane protein YdbT with pleckstrin-like domain